MPRGATPKARTQPAVAARRVRGPAVTDRQPLWGKTRPLPPRRPKREDGDDGPDRVAVVAVALRGNNIKDRLQELSMTQEQGAEAAGVSYRHFNRIVLSRCDPSLLIVARLEAVLKAPYTTLFNIDVKTRPVEAE